MKDDDGGWAPHIQYATNDRVLYEGRLFLARAGHAALPGQPPPSSPALWQELPQTFCGQLTTFCGDIEDDAAAACNVTGLAGDEAACQGTFAQCLAQCAPSDLSGAGHQHEDYASYCGQLASACHSDATELGVECHDLGHGGDEAACEVRHVECLGRCTPSRPTRATFRPAPLSASAGGSP